MTEVWITNCDLHIPHKKWSGDPREEQNYLEMERWAQNFYRFCCAGGGAAGGIPPESPAILVAGVRTTDFCQTGLTPGPALEDNVRFNPSSAAPGITWDTLNGTGITIQPYWYGSAFFAEQVHFSFPPVTNMWIHLTCTFHEPTGLATEPINRNLHIRVRRNTDSVDAVDLAKIFTGTRASTPCDFSIGPYDIEVPFTIHCYNLWNSVKDTGAAAHNQLVGGGQLIVTGDL